MPAPPARQVFKRMGFVVAREEYEAVVNCEAGAVERVLKLAKTRMARFQEAGGRRSLSRSSSAGGGSQPQSPAAGAGVGVAEVQVRCARCAAGEVGCVGDGWTAPGRRVPLMWG